MAEFLLGLGIFIYVILFILWITLVVVVGFYAKRLGRDLGCYILLSVLLSPFFSIIILLLLGETDEHRKARVIEEEMWRRSLEAGLLKDDKSEEKDIMDVLTK